NSIDAGGVFASSTASGMTMSATLGQPDVGVLSAQGVSLSGGFWAMLPETGFCQADWDGNGLLEPADIAAYVNARFLDLSAGTLTADVDGSGAIDPADIAMFVNLWYQGLNGNGC